MLILNLSAVPDKETPSVNDTTDGEIAPESMQFGRAFQCILQVIWEADTEEGPVRLSKLYVTEAYHRGSLKPSQVVAFAYIVPLVSDDDVIFSEMLTDVANALVDTDLPVPAYGAISALPATEPGPPHSSLSLTHIDCYMDDVIGAVQGGAERNTESLTAQSVLSSGFSPRYPGKPMTECRSRSFWPGKETGSASRKSSGGLLTPRREQSPSHSASSRNSEISWTFRPPSGAWGGRN